ncbi:hypothetical protein [Apibacter adventoris]|uniref:hypothetical protein n=1 Tax=Apibacter adventoris TaxID=1679466 RepID=UPI0015E389DF|nr:hypothetical protein [Apibacter adventoris]
MEIRKLKPCFFCTVSGGFRSALIGGNFWQGAATGLIISGLNNEMHKLFEE